VYVLHLSVRVKCPNLSKDMTAISLGCLERTIQLVLSAKPGEADGKLEPFQELCKRADVLQKGKYQRTSSVGVSRSVHCVRVILGVAALLFIPPHSHKKLPLYFVRDL